MPGLLARHEGDKQGKTDHRDSEEVPSNFIAWLPWGGAAGKAWADRKAKTIDWTGADCVWVWHANRLGSRPVILDR